MTDTELRDGACRISSRFNELLFQLPGNKSDNVENMSDLKLAYDSKSGADWDPAFTYPKDVLISFENNIYISKIAANTSNKPNISPASWKRVDVKNLSIGEFYVSATCVVKQNVYNSNDYANYQLVNAWNFTSLVEQGGGILKLNIDPSAGVYNTNYLVMTSGTHLYSTNNIGQTKPVFHMANIIQKTDTYILVKVPLDRYKLQFTLSIVPIQ